MSLPDEIIAVLVAFQPVFTQPTWQKALVLVIGTLRARGRRTVTTALRQMGYAQCADFSRFHQVLNRAHWSCLALSRRLLQLLVHSFIATGGRLTIVVDEHLERRWGRRITKRGHYRDPLASSKGQSVSTSGLRWVVLALVVQPPWTTHYWALPFLSILATPPEVSAQLGRHHKTVGDWAAQVVVLLRRWLPEVPIELVGDRSYSSIELGLHCQDQQVALITPLRLDANLFAPPPSRSPRQTGRPRVKGGQLPKLDRALTDPQTHWQTAELAWYSGGPRKLEWCSATALWYHSGHRPLAIRWVLVRDPAGKHDPKAYLCTDGARQPLEIVQAYMKRWPLEVTFEESRAHLGVETQRQWSDRAIERSTPVLLGLYSLVTLLGQALTRTGQIPVQQTAWYHKEQATFSDVLAVVRRELWGNFRFCTSPDNPDLLLIPRAVLDQLAFAVCY
jgi:DDE superfamily endonuclease